MFRFFYGDLGAASFRINLTFCFYTRLTKEPGNFYSQQKFFQ